MGHLKRGIVVLSVVMLTGCAGGSTSSTSASAGPQSPEPSASAAAAATGAPTATPSVAATVIPSTGPTSFKSETYGYSVTLPAGWTVTPATARWDGKAGLSSDSSEVDQFIGPASATSTGVAAPYGKKLADYVKDLLAWNFKYHGDTCPAKPDSQSSIKIGGVPAVLVQWNCGILINSAVAVRNGVAYQFLFRDQAIQAATDPADKATFLTLLASVKFPT